MRWIGESLYQLPSPHTAFIMPPDHSALLAHIVSQTRQNVEFLMAQNEISRDVGQGILSNLPTASDITVRELSEQTRRMAIPPSSPPPGTPSGPPVRRSLQPQPNLQRAKALWTYNENGSVSNFAFSFQLNADGCVFRNLMICPSVRAISLRWSLKQMRIGGLAG
jgi:hypothetical protein